MLNNPKARRAVSGLLDPPAKLLLRLHISPDAVTLVGTLGAALCAVFFIARGSFVIGVVGVIIFAVADLLDGTMARMKGTSGPWGNFLDASLDRVADGAIFGSVAFWAASEDQMWLAAGTLIALIAGQVTSYTKARAEAVGAQANVGLVERAERLIAILAALFLAGVGVPWVLDIVVWALAGLGVLTVIQRAIHVRKQLKPPSETPQGFP
jgi:CDP-diacylglycerol--glycerol-3-phosphate 3-phosphatidyltransferase